MASYTIIPTAFEYSEADNVENPEKAYDSSGSTYATVDMDDANEHVYLYAFNFSQIPQGEVVTSITAKVKLCGSCDLGDCLVWLQSTADGTGVKLSADTTPATSVSTKTLSLTADVATIMSYASTLSVAFSHDGVGATFNIYAAYFTVTTAEVGRNKIIYGNETLIDLTGDTATASDVASGKTFHLASGLQATGAFSPTMETKDASLTSVDVKLSFTGLAKEPSWFVALYNGASAKTGYPVTTFLFDGTNASVLYCYSTSSANTVTCVRSSGSDITFTYSARTLKLSINGYYFMKGTYTLYYM